MKNLLEKQLKSICLNKGNSVSFYRDTVMLPNGKRAFRDYLRHPGAVTIMAFLDKEHIVMERQYRYPVRKAIYELPAGKIDQGENPAICAKRELLEETGFWPRRLKRMLSFWPTPAFATETMHIYCAWDLEHRVVSKDEDEFLEHFSMKISQAIDWIDQGKIKDAKTLIALMALKTFRWNPYE